MQAAAAAAAVITDTSPHSRLSRKAARFLSRPCRLLASFSKILVRTRVGRVTDGGHRKMSAGQHHTTKLIESKSKKEHTHLDDGHDGAVIALCLIAAHLGLRLIEHMVVVATQQQHVANGARVAAIELRDGEKHECTSRIGATP